MMSALFEHCFDFVFESEVQSLKDNDNSILDLYTIVQGLANLDGKTSDTIGQIASPER